MIQTLLFVLFPAFALWSVKKSKALDAIGAVVICYALGILLANQPFFSLDKNISNQITEATVPLAIPMLLFTTNFLLWFKSSRATIISFVLAMIAVVIASFIGVYVFSDQIPGINKVAGMLVGVYTGGTPNMSAIGLALEVPNETFILLNSTDTFVSAVYLIFLLFFAKRLLSRFYPEYKPLDNTQEVEEKSDELGSCISEKLKNVGKCFISSVGIVGISVGISFLFTGKMSIAYVILGLTSFGIIASFIPWFRKIPGSFAVGNYLLLIFAIAIGSGANISELIQGSSGILFYTVFVLSISVFMHFLLGWIFRIDLHTIMITSTAGIFGPAFVATVAQSLKNKEIIVAGLATGLVGYAVGNYLGLALYYILTNV